MRLKREDWEFLSDMKNKIYKVGQHKIDREDDYDIDVRITKDDIRNKTDRERVSGSVLENLAKEFESPIIKPKVDKNGITLTLDMKEYRYKDRYSIDRLNELVEEIEEGEDDY